MSTDPPIKPTLEVSTSAKATVADAAPVWGAPRRPTSVASGCLACQTPSAPSDHGGALHFAHPLGHTLGKLRRTLAARFQLVPSPVGAFAALVPAGALREVAEAASEALNAAERASCKVLFEADSKESAREERTQLERVVTLEDLLGQLGSSWLVSMLAEDRFYSAFQPIVAAANLFEPFAYECLLRGVAEDGSTVYPDAIFSTARAAGLLFQVDRAARLSAIRCASAQGLGTPLFINFNPTAIYDPKFCLKATTDAIHKAGIAPERIVFEIVESDQVGSLEHLLNIVSYYRERGFRVALDDLGSGYSSLTLLAKLKPDFVKFDRGLVEGIDGDVYKQKLFTKLLELARELGALTLAEGVETEGETRWLLERRVDLLQGYFFARPALSPPLPQPHFRAPRPGAAERPQERTLA